MAKLRVFLDGTQTSETRLDKEKEYLVGRGSTCDVVLNHPKVSRQHLKITFANNLWNCHVLSRFGNVEVNGHQVGNFSLTDNVKIKIPPYEIQYIESKSQKTKENELAGLPSGGDVDEHTQVIEVQLKGLLTNDQSGDKITIGSEKITAGRSQISDVRLTDNEASRRHFTIEYDGKNYILTDLNSANKTYVNDKEVTTHTLESGDRIRVGSDRFHFEIVNPDFEGVPALVIGSPSASQTLPAGPSASSLPNRSVIKVVPGQVSKGAFAPIPIKDWGALTQILTDPKLKTKAALAVIVIVILFQVFGGKKNDDQKGSGQVTLNSQQQDKTYDKLTPEQQKFIDDTYNLAMNLYTSGRYDMAAIEIEKIFRYVNDYKGARNLYDSCRQARAIQKEQDEQNRIKAEREELQRRVTETLDHCEDLLKSSRFSDVEGCVAQIENLDPDNERGRNLVLDAKQRQAAIESNSEHRAEQTRKRNMAYQAFGRAQKSFKDHNYLPALKEFETVRKLAFVDTEHLKEKAETGIKSVKAQLVKESEALVQDGKASLDQKDYSTALQKFSKALQIYPNNGDAMEYRDQASKELHLEMKNLYSESVIEENLGNVDSAKKKWKTIIKEDEKTDNYYEKSQIKLRKYEK